MTVYLNGNNISPDNCYLSAVKIQTAKLTQLEVQQDIHLSDISSPYREICHTINVAVL